MALTAATIYDEFVAGLTLAIKTLDVQSNSRIWTEWIKDYFTELGERKGRTGTQASGSIAWWGTRWTIGG